MKNYHQTTIAGLMGTDPQLVDFRDTQLCNFALALKSCDRCPETGEWHYQRTVYHVGIIGDKAGACAGLLHKGCFVKVVGKLRAVLYDGQPFLRLIATDALKVDFWDTVPTVMSPCEIALFLFT